MSAMPEHLLLSRFWGIRRPRHPLTPGHFIIRLTDPAMAFGPASAADLLRCYAHLRRSLTEFAGATAAQLYISLNWQPVGDALGEPVAETSTPTLHTFFALPESTTAAAALRLPAHRRVPPGNAGETEALDAAVRRWQPGPDVPAGAAPENTAPDVAEAPAPTPAGSPGLDHWAARGFHVEPARPLPGEPFRAGHWTAVPRMPAESLDEIPTGALLELAGWLESAAAPAGPIRPGVTVWVSDEWNVPAPSSLHLFVRQHGPGTGAVADFVAAGGLDLPVAPAWQGKSDGPSPTVEK